MSDVAALVKRERETRERLQEMDGSDRVALVHEYEDRIEQMEVEVERLPEALAWYGEQARLCRLIHSGGDAGRQALGADGGKRARAALGLVP